MLLEHFQLAVAAYDDWFIPELAQSVLDEVLSRPHWELEVIIAAEAAYAENFLSPN